MNTFIEKEEYQQLLFAALGSLPGLELIRSDANIELLPPAIRKPKELWTGKQVISTLLNHLRKGNDRDEDPMFNFQGLSMERKTKTPASAFGASYNEHMVIVRDGDLLQGVLDKAAFGASDFSLVHAVYEAYGPSRAGLLLNAFGRLFTAYIQYYSGHSCRMEDLILTPEADEKRRQMVKVREVFHLKFSKLRPRSEQSFLSNNSNRMRSVLDLGQPRHGQTPMAERLKSHP